MTSTYVTMGFAIFDKTMLVHETCVWNFRGSGNFIESGAQHVWTSDNDNT